jgi:PAS domain S-box-containing protein
MLSLSRKMPARNCIIKQSLETHRIELLLGAVIDYAIYLIDLEGFVATWNKGAERIKGYSSVEIIGQHFSRFFTPEDRAAGLPDKILTAARVAGRHETEGWRLRKDGTRLWCNAIIQQVRDEEGELIGFAKITRDITERMKARDALLESERRFRLLVEGVVDYAIYMLDPSGLVVNWNTGARRLKGYSTDEIVGQHFSRFYATEDRRAGLPARVLEEATRVGRYESEGWRVRKDGSRFWASVVIDEIRNEKGELEGFAKVTRDITERRAAQDAVRESERQFRLLVAGVTDYALYMLDLNGIVTSWNAGAERIKGYSADEIIGQHFSRFYTEQDRAAGVPARALYTASQEGRFEAENWRVRKDGTLFWANVVIDPVRDEHGTLIGFAKITRDITERRDAQKALEEAQLQRAHAQKMDALGQLTGGVAHDFNNLLMVVSGHIQTIKRNIGEDPKLVRASEAIALAAKRGATLTRQLLTFSRRQPFRPVVLSLRERIDALSSMLASSLGNATKLVATIDAETWPVRVDSSELELALMNIVLNARDAMPAGGVISVTTENSLLSRTDTPANVEGEFVALRITDTGSGIPEDVLRKVFEPFFTTKGANKGSGLGLSQVYGFVHQSGGTVTIDSALAKGTTVTLYLPRAREEVPPAPEASEIEGRSDRGTVLVVEDNPEVSEVTVSMLEQIGYQAQGVVDANAALAAIAANSFDLVISDIVMAGTSDGLTLARAIRELQPNLPVLLVTGYSNVAAEAREEFPMLCKPVELADLNRATSQIIARAKRPASSNIIQLRNTRTASRSGSDEK